jgi:D-glycero-D-manno-heptose 1,7-bisphosphate phosphatase
MKNIIFDRDGIINEVVMRNGSPSSPWKKDEFSFKTDIFSVVKKLHLYKYQIFIASNQPDIARGNLLEKDLNYFNDLISNKLKISKRNIYICKHDNQHNCECRKPKPGMLNKILNDFNLKLDETCFIGDSLKDLEAASSIDMKFFYLKTEYNTQPKKQVEIIHSLKDLQIKG